MAQDAVGRGTVLLATGVRVLPRLCAGSMSPAVSEWVSVVMPVRNALPYLDASIGSILDQEHRQFELVIGDDGSTDGSTDRLREWAQRDLRIRLVIGDKGGLGPAGSSNWVARMARYPVVARMDADDISAPSRLAAQLAALRACPDAVLVGSLFDCINAAGAPVRPRNRACLSDLASPFSPFAHGSIMFRRSAFEQAGGYREEANYWEDQDLYWRMAEIGRLLVLPEAHYSYRYHNAHARLAAETRQVERALHLARVCVAARRRGEDHAALLKDGAEPNDERISLLVFAAIGTLQLWSGRRPRVLGNMLKRGKLRVDRETIMALSWAVASTAAPGATRAMLQIRLRLREAMVHRSYPDGRIYEWRPFGAPSRSA